MKRTALLKRRNRTESGTTDEAAPAERRRRIAGERPATGDDEPAADERPEETDNRPGGADTSETSKPLSRLLTLEPPDRAQVVAALSAAGTGVVVGAVLTGLVYAGMRAFEAIYNTPAGNGVGAIVLLAVVVVSLLVGRYLLRWRGLPDPNATTLLGLALMAIVTLGALLPIVFSSWMLLITPLLGGVSYLVAHLLVAHFGERS